MDLKKKEPGCGYPLGPTDLVEQYRTDIQANWRDAFQKFGLDPEQCTCLHCPDNRQCRHAFAGFNYGGDCLAEQ